MANIMDRIINRIDKISNLCYTQKETEAMAQMPELTECFIKYMDKLTEASVSSESRAQFQTMLQWVLNALEDKDYILLADILVFQIKPFMEDIKI